jgi:hypothetical protein
MMTPPLSISANPIFKRSDVPVIALFPFTSGIVVDLGPERFFPRIAGKMRSGCNFQCISEVNLDGERARDREVCAILRPFQSIGCVSGPFAAPFAAYGCSANIGH